MLPALTSLEPRLLANPPAPAILVVPALTDVPRTVRGAVGLPPTTVSLLLHGLLLLLILLGLPDWLQRQHDAPPPVIEVALVLPPPPAPQPPPAPPRPQARVPLASDAASEGPSPPKPAEPAQAAPAATEPGPTAAPARKPEPPRAVSPPLPRSTLAVPRPAPPDSPPRAAEPAPQTALAVPAPEPAPTDRGEQPAAPKTGSAPRTGFTVAAAVAPGGRNAAVYNAYLAAVRDKIAEQRRLLKPYYLSGGGVVMGLVIDRAGRLIDAGVMQSSGSRALDHTVSQMVTLAAPFGPPPAEIDGTRISLRFDLVLPTTAAEWDQMMAPGKPG